VAFRPEEYDWERWLGWNKAVTKHAHKALTRAEQKLVSQIERLVDAPVSYFYINENWRERIMYGDIYRMDETEFCPTARWINRCRELDIDVHPWLWDQPGAAMNAVDVYSEVMQFGWHIHVTQMTEVNALLRIVTSDGYRSFCFAFEVSAYDAENIRRGFIKGRRVQPVDPHDANVIMNRKLTELEKPGQMVFDPDILGAPMGQRLGWMRLDKDELG